MKSCEYCNKEITYHEQYCSKECEEKTVEYYNMISDHTKKFNNILKILLLLFAISLFWILFQANVGFIVFFVTLFLTGIFYNILPFPTMWMIEKKKIEKSIKITKLIGRTFISISLLAIAVILMFFM